MTAALLAPPALPTRCQWCDLPMRVLLGVNGAEVAVCHVCDTTNVQNRRPHPLLRKVAA